MYGLDYLYDMFAPPTLNEILIDEESEDAPYQLCLVMLSFHQLQKKSSVVD